MSPLIFFLDSSSTRQTAFGGTAADLMYSMNGEIRIWDVRAPEKPLYEKLAQPLGLAGLAVHTGAPILATSVPHPMKLEPKFKRLTLVLRTSAPSAHANRQRLVIQGFSNPTKPKTLSKLDIPLSVNLNAPQRPVGFMPSAASLAFHPVSSRFPGRDWRGERAYMAASGGDGRRRRWIRHERDGQDVPVPNAREPLDVGAREWGSLVWHGPRYLSDSREAQWWIWRASKCSISSLE